MEYDDMGVKVERIGPQMEKEMDQLVPHSSGFVEWVSVLAVWLHPQHLEIQESQHILTARCFEKGWSDVLILQLKLGCFFPPLHLLERLFQGVFQSVVNNQFLRLILIIC